MALLGGREVAGLHVGAVLRDEADRHGRRLDELITSNDEHLAVLRQLEQAYDEEPNGRRSCRAPRHRSSTAASRAATRSPQNSSGSCASRRR